MMKESSTNLILSEAVVPCYVLRRVPTGPGGVALGADAGSNSVLTLSLCVCVCVCVCVCMCGFDSGFSISFFSEVHLNPDNSQLMTLVNVIRLNCD